MKSINKFHTNKKELENIDDFELIMFIWMCYIVKIKPCKLAIFLKIVYKVLVTTNHLILLRFMYSSVGN